MKLKELIERHPSILNLEYLLTGSPKQVTIDLSSHIWNKILRGYQERVEAARNLLANFRKRGFEFEYLYCDRDDDDRTGHTVALLRKSSRSPITYLPHFYTPVGIATPCKGETTHHNIGEAIASARAIVANGENLTKKEYFLLLTAMGRED